MDKINWTSFKESTLLVALGMYPPYGKLRFQHLISISYFLSAYFGETVTCDDVANKIQTFYSMDPETTTNFDFEGIGSFPSHFQLPEAFKLDYDGVEEDLEDEKELFKEKKSKRESLSSPLNEQNYSGRRASVEKKRKIE